jgi:hypothetical protein
MPTGHQEHMCETAILDWTMGALSWQSKVGSEQEGMEWRAFLEMRWSSTSSPLKYKATIQDALLTPDPVKITVIIHAVNCTKASGWV